MVMTVIKIPSPSEQRGLTELSVLEDPIMDIEAVAEMLNDNASNENSVSYLIDRLKDHARELRAATTKRGPCRSARAHWKRMKGMTHERRPGRPRPTCRRDCLS